MLRPTAQQESHGMTSTHTFLLEGEREKDCVALPSCCVRNEMNFLKMTTLQQRGLSAVYCLPVM
ncbi:Hypothetical predicted protein [Podarcis lilfordi]|uniref:Uncharacterized protein n=1 Tax=Podarcis lilfordi TaxID=74358 RepID=A0AA35NXT6_9SAUR|nr:Hypothetical predicted protein [Podarcis lilfordi]